LAKGVEGLARHAFLGYLPSEFEPMGAVPGNGFHALKARQFRPIRNLQDVPPPGTRPHGFKSGRICPPHALQIVSSSLQSWPLLAMNGGFMSATIKRFDDLPDDAVVPRRVTAAVLHMSERTVQRSIPTIKLSTRRRGNRVGDIRKIARGDTPQGV
jgi:hypothetical protein